MAILFDGFVTSSLGLPTPSPSFPLDGPSAADSVSAPLYDAASIMPSISVPSTDTPTVYTAESVAIIVTPEAAPTESAPALDTPSEATAQAVPATDTPTAATSANQPSLDTPSAAVVQSVPALDTPDALTSRALDHTTPPFPLNHARILWDNKLFNYSSVSASTGSNQADAIIPNTYQKWEFSATGWVKIILPTAVSIDTICVCAHNLSDGGYSVRPYYRATAAGSLVGFDAVRSPDNNNSIMWHVDTPVIAEVIEIYTTAGSGDGFIGYISAGIALQMQRPFFGGHTPVSENLKYEYFDAWTESGQLVGRSERAVMIEGSYSWQNIDDTWYRAYFEPFKRTGHRLPFVMAWNLLQYPNDCEMVLPQAIEAAPYSGTRNLRSIEMTVKGPE